MSVLGDAVQLVGAITGLVGAVTLLVREVRKPQPRKAPRNDPKQGEKLVNITQRDLSVARDDDAAKRLLAPPNSSRASRASSQAS